MGMIDDNLKPGERIVHRCGVHPTVLVLPILGSFLGTAVCVWLGIVGESFGCCAMPFIVVLVGAGGSLLEAVSKLSSTEYVITDQRLIITTGLFRNRYFEVPLDRIESIWIDRPFLGQVLGYGNVLAVGSDRYRYAMPQMHEPTRFKEALEVQRQARREPLTQEGSESP